MILEQVLVRYAISGTLITCYGLIDHRARRAERAHRKAPRPRWLGPLVLVSLTGFYLLIKPTGGPLLGGLGNLIGVALCGLACFLRTTGAVRYPDLAARGLFYLALPIAVGVPWGLLALSLPACAASIYCAHGAEQLRLAASSLVDPLSAEPRYRLLHGVW